MGNPRVFISHSAKEWDAREMLNVLIETLRNEGFDPMIDSELLRNGELWWERLQQELQCSHAVMALVSPSALQSPHVLREVTLAMAARVDARGHERFFVLRMPT